MNWTKFWLKVMGQNKINWKNCWNPKSFWIWQSAAELFTLEEKVQRLGGLGSVPCNTPLASNTFG
jgi:hypothetical protein